MPQTTPPDPISGEPRLSKPNARSTKNPSSDDVTAASSSVSVSDSSGSASEMPQPGVCVL